MSTRPSVDRGVIFEHELRIVPGSDGSFIVYANVGACSVWPLWAFTHVTDLMSWLQDHALAFDARGPQEGIKEPKKWMPPEAESAP